MPFDASDWSAAADIARPQAEAAKEVADAAQAAATEARADLSVLGDRITAEVSARTTTDAAVTALSTTVTQTADAWSVTAGAMQAQIDSAADVAGDVSSHMAFSADGMTIGRSDSDMQMHLDNDSMDFMARGMSVLELDGRTSTAKAERVQVGRYRWTSTNGGANLSLLYVGGE